MDLNKILENFIRKYFEKKRMPKIRETARLLNEKYGGESYAINCFGYQTFFMMRYMLMLFGAVCVLMLLAAIVVNREAFEGVKIFGSFFVLCLILWLFCKGQSGFIVYGSRWLYIERAGKKQEFAFETLEKMDVLGKLTLIFRSGKCVIPLEGVQYMDFMRFMEKNCPEIVRAIPKETYDKALRKHVATWGNRM